MEEVNAGIMADAPAFRHNAGTTDEPAFTGSSRHMRCYFEGQPSGACSGSSFAAQSLSVRDSRGACSKIQSR